MNLKKKGAAKLLCRWSIIAFIILSLGIWWACGGGDSDFVDTDGDGLSDADEMTFYLTDPNNPDTDEDGMSDGEEATLGSNALDTGDPFQPCSGSDAAKCSACWNDAGNKWCCPSGGCGKDSSTCQYTQCKNNKGSCAGICTKPSKNAGGATNIKITNTTSKPITIAFVTGAVGGACADAHKFISYEWVAKNTAWCKDPIHIGGEGAGHCTGTVPAGQFVEVKRTGDDAQKCLTGAILIGGKLSCPTPTGFTQGEFTLNPTNTNTEAVDISLVNGANYALTVHLPGDALAVQDGGAKVTSIGPNEGLHGNNKKNGIFPPGCTDCIVAVKDRIPCPAITPNPQCQQKRICNIYRGGVTGGTVEYVIGDLPK